MSLPPSPSPRPGVSPGPADVPSVDAGRQQFFARYRELVLAGIMLGLLVLGVLVLNLTMVRQLEADAAENNIAARQRDLTQRITKDALQIQAQIALNQSVTTLMNDLRIADTWFRTTLAAFQDGGAVDGTVPDQKVTIHKAVSEEAQKLIRDALGAWQPVQEAIARVVAAPNNTPVRGDIADLVEKAQRHNLSTYTSMNDLTNELTNLSRARAARLRWIQAAAVALVLGLLAYITYFFVGKLRRSDAQQLAAEARLRESNVSLEGSTAKLNGLLQENALILSTVKQGLLIIDSKNRIGNTYSKESENILRVENLAGVNFLSLLQRLLTEKMYGTTRDYLELMFNPAKKEKQLAKINPLNQVDINFPNNEGGFDTRYLEFAFKRVMDGKETVANVFVSARDITEQVLLEKQLREAERRKDRQFEILSSALHVEPAQFREFIDAADRELKLVNETLKADSLVEVARGADGQEELRKRLNTIFRAAHGIKGNAEFIGARYFVQSVHEFEDKIRELRDRPTLKPEDLLSVVILQASLVADLEEARGLQGRLGSLRSFSPRPEPPAAAPVAAPPPSRAAAPAATPRPTPPAAPAPMPSDWPPDGLLGSFHTMLQNLAGSLGKQVQLTAAGFQEAQVGGHRELVRDILIQLGRNSLAHGIEAPVERMAAGKPTRGTVTITLAPENSDGSLRLVFRDDGRGLDPARIRAKALALKLASADQLSEMDDSEAVLMIFEPGFSTAEKVDELAGRGVGLDLLRQRVLDDLGGEISVDSQPGRFCEFHLVLPPLPATVSADSAA